jgi:hypothetical protein
MDIVQRVQLLLLKPKEEWVKIKAEPTSTAKLFSSYVMIVAAIPAIAQLIDRSIIGRRVPFYGVIRLGIGKGVAYALVSYVLSLAAAYILGFIIYLLAPNFSSEQNRTNAMKLAVYSLTPFWLAGILYIIHDLASLVYIISLYGLYLLYLGFEAPMLGTPKDRIMGYVVVCLVVIIVLIAVFGWFPGMILSVRYGRL